MKSILDPSFQDTASFNTDLTKTFDKIRRAEAESAMQATAGVLVNVSSIVRKTAYRPVMRPALRLSVSVRIAFH